MDAVTLLIDTLQIRKVRNLIIARSGCPLTQVELDGSLLFIRRHHVHLVYLRL